MEEMRQKTEKRGENNTKSHKANRQNKSQKW